MRKIIILTIAICLILLPSTFAEMGKSIEEFKKSKFVETFKIKYNAHRTLTSEFNTPDIRNKEAFNFKAQNGRYEIELVADRNGNNIIKQDLSYPITDNEAQATEDSGCALAFVMEACGNKISANEFASLVKSVTKNWGAQNNRQSKRINGYLVQVQLYTEPFLNLWAITVKRQNE